MRLGPRATLVAVVVSLPALARAQALPTIGFSTDASSGGETGTFDMSVVLTNPDGNATTAPATVNFTTLQGTAISGSDFVANSGQLTFPTGTVSGTAQTITVSLVPDGLSE